jgi:hypothetical protein
MVTNTQSTDLFQTNPGVNAINFDQDNETWIISTSINVLSQSGYGIFSDHANSVVINGGQIYGAGSSQLSGYGNHGVGVNLQDGGTGTGGNGTVTNAADAQIVGLEGGVTMADHGTNSVTNYGAIIGGVLDGVLFSGGASDALNNYGEIYGGDAAVDVATDPSVVTDIHNAEGGVLMGGYQEGNGTPSAVIVENGNLHLTNLGTIIGDIFANGGGNDVIVNPGRIEGTIYLNGGHDIFNGAHGHSGAISCGDGNDAVDAGLGQVAIHVVGTGSDLLTAGPGHDKFFFEAVPGGQVDEIDKFNPSLDKIVLSESAFPGLGPHVTKGVLTLAPGHFSIGSPGGHAITSPLIVYDPNDGFLYYEHRPLLGHPSAVHFATLATHSVVDNHVVTTHPLISNVDILLEA